MQISLIAKGMHCKSCKLLVEEALQELGAKNIHVIVDEKSQTGKVRCDFSDKAKVISTIEKEGYNVVA